MCHASGLDDMVIEALPMQHFMNGDLRIAYLDAGPRDAFPILLIHGFASTAHINWVNTGWVKTLTDAGHRVIALDNRGHGVSDKPHDPDRYTLAEMKSDSVALLDHLSVRQANVMGYSMGASITVRLALDDPDRAASLIFGGRGSAILEPNLDWKSIADGLRAPSADDVTGEPARRFRLFADQTGSDRLALAACIQSIRTFFTEQELATIEHRALVATGTKDDIAGPPEPFAEALAHGAVFHIEGKDHMLAVGDKTYKAAVLEFLASGSGSRVSG
ncbi:MAG: alpha/beta hydrolase [Rhizobiaceae bacterium MnEN-MB40S]|nr:MAG: alpha/beta hydrolase [Rhizobiaceae bacterium MnEN-MB40S]